MSATRRCPIINISGGTEIVGCFLSVLPIQPLKPCTLGGPAPGMATEVVDEAGRPVRGTKGYLVCQKPVPSMTRGVWGDPARYIESYWSRWPGWWNHGDWASVDEDGHWFVYGRADESMNVAGRKVGPAEVEDALIEHAAVSEAAVIGVPDPLKGESIVAFVVTKPGIAWNCGARTAAFGTSGGFARTYVQTSRDSVGARAAEDAERQDCPASPPAEIPRRGAGRSFHCRKSACPRRLVS